MNRLIAQHLAYGFNISHELIFSRYIFLR